MGFECKAFLAWTKVKDFLVLLTSLLNFLSVWILLKSIRSIKLSFLLIIQSIAVEIKRIASSSSIIAVSPTSLDVLALPIKKKSLPGLKDNPSSKKLWWSGP